MQLTLYSEGSLFGGCGEDNLAKQRSNHRNNAGGQECGQSCENGGIGAQKSNHNTKRSRNEGNDTDIRKLFNVFILIQTVRTVVNIVVNNHSSAKGGNAYAKDIEEANEIVYKAESAEDGRENTEDSGQQPTRNSVGADGITKAKNGTIQIVVIGSPGSYNQNETSKYAKTYLIDKDVTQVCRAINIIETKRLSRVRPKRSVKISISKLVRRGAWKSPIFIKDTSSVSLSNTYGAKKRRIKRQMT